MNPFREYEWNEGHMVFDAVKTASDEYAIAVGRIGVHIDACQTPVVPRQEEGYPLTDRPRKLDGWEDPQTDPRPTPPNRRQYLFGAPFINAVEIDGPPVFPPRPRAAEEGYSPFNGTADTHDRLAEDHVAAFQVPLIEAFILVEGNPASWPIEHVVAEIKLHHSLTRYRSRTRVNDTTPACAWLFASEQAALRKSGAPCSRSRQ
jgi:hypothetical protein